MLDTVFIYLKKMLKLAIIIKKAFIKKGENNNDQRIN